MAAKLSGEFWQLDSKSETKIRLIDFDTDLQDVLAIERSSWEVDPWNAMHFRDSTKYAQTLHYVLSVDDLAIGFISVVCRDGVREIVNLAVLPSHRRHGVARLLVGHVTRIAEARKACVTAMVRESNLPALRLMRVCEIPAVGLMPGRYIDPDDDGVLFVRGYSNGGENDVGVKPKGIGMRGDHRRNQGPGDQDSGRCSEAGA